MNSATKESQERRRFELDVASNLRAEDVEGWAREAKGRDSREVRLALAAAFAHAAFAAPERIASFYDAAARGWFGAPIKGPVIAQPPGSITPPTPEFWSAFWCLADAASGLSSGDATGQTASLGGLLDPSLHPRSALTCLAYPGVEAASRAGLPDRIALDDLAACPAGSLGEAFYRLIVDNDFDLEVLDRDALGLADLLPPLDYLNTRMLQTHDLWHIVAGYQTTKLHEVAISAFQMAQFGHGYSAVFLALTTTTAALAPVNVFDLLIDTIVSAWMHGRRTPPMLLIPWEQVWEQSADQIRERFSVSVYESPYPADIFERYEAGKTALTG